MKKKYLVEKKNKWTIVPIERETFFQQIFFYIHIKDMTVHSLSPHYGF